MTSVPLRTVIIPSQDCWEHRHSSQDEDCTLAVQNFFGLLALGGLLVLMITALMRRRFYALFYACHILSTPIILITLMFHYDRAIVYLMPSILYYTASWLPNYMKQYRQAATFQNGGIRISSIERIMDTSSHNHSNTTRNKTKACCFAVSFQVTQDTLKNHYQPGMYIKLQVPSISSIAHPFTINKVSSSSTTNDNSQQQLRIIFRVFGSFTKQLAKQISNNAETIPIMYIAENTFHHGVVPDMVQTSITQHDTIVCIAGGIGITPYLSYLHDLCHCILSTPNKNNDNNNNGSHIKTERVVLHWMCRDTSLVKYIQSEYIHPLEEMIHQHATTSQNPLQVQISIHSTSTVFSMRSAKRRSATYDPLQQQMDQQDMMLYEFDHDWPHCIAGRLGMPFQHAKSRHWASLIITWISFVVFLKMRQSDFSTRTIVVVMIFSIALLSWMSIKAAMMWHEYSRRGRTEETFAGNINEKSESYPLLPLHGTTLAATTDTNQLNSKIMKSLQTQATSLTSSYESVLLHSSPSSASLSETSSHGNAPATFSMQQRGGRRPAVHELLECVDVNVEHAGVFCCGPNELIDEIHAEAKRKPRAVAVYDEAFIM